MHSSNSRSRKASSTGQNVGTWMTAEDDRLREAVLKHGPRWVVVANEVGTRNGDQCAKRWNENLNPELDHGPWCQVEDKLLLHLVELYGHNWKFIANKFFEKRAPLALKNRNSYLKRRQKRQEQGNPSAKSSSNTPPGANTSPSAHTSPHALFQNNPLNGSGDMSAHMLGCVPTAAPVLFPGSPGSSSSGVMDGELARLTSRVNSATDLTDVLNTYSSNTTAGSPQMGTSQIKSPTVDPAQVSTGAEHFAFNDLIGATALLGSMTDDNVNMALDTGLDMDPDVQSLDRDLLAEHVFEPEAADLPGSDTDCAVEYALTCPKGKLKSLVEHLIDAAMSGKTSAGPASEEQVMLSLRLKTV